MTFSERLRQHARYRPGKQAIVEPNRSIDYRTLDRMVDHTAHALAAKGAIRDRLVGLSLSDRAEHLIVLLAMTRIGAVIVPLDPRWTAAETAGVAGNFGADLILTDRADADPAWTVLTDADFGESDAPYDDPEVGLDTAMLLSLSSGTTGMPKGPLVSQGKFIDRFMVYWLDLKLSGQDRFVTATPLYFGGGRGFALAMLWAGGTALLLCPPYQPADLVAFVAEQRGTAMFLVPTLLSRMVEAATPGCLSFPTIDVLISSGSALYPSVAQAVREKLSPNLYQYYSSTEGGGCTVLAPEALAAHPESVGQPCCGVEVEVVDDAHRALPAGATGRLRYRSAASADHYYRGEAGDTFRDGFFYPGDLGAFDAEGFLYLRGRSKDMIIRGGVNIYPGDIEAVLLRHDDVIEAAVVGVPSPDFGEEIAAAVVLRADADCDALRRHCAGVLAKYKVPRFILPFADLPKTSLGKIDKKALALAAGDRVKALQR